MYLNKGMEALLNITGIFWKVSTVPAPINSAPSIQGVVELPHKKPIKIAFKLENLGGAATNQEHRLLARVWYCTY